MKCGKLLNQFLTGGGAGWFVSVLDGLEIRHALAQQDLTGLELTHRNRVLERILHVILELVNDARDFDAITHALDEGMVDGFAAVEGHKSTTATPAMMAATV